MENKTKYFWKSSKTQANTLTCSFDENFPTSATRCTTTNNANAEPQQQQHNHRNLQQHQHQPQQQQTNVRFSSSSSLTDGSSCALTHQYHYIQYPHYYQVMQDRLHHSYQSTSQTQLQRTNCQCHCSCRKVQESDNKTGDYLVVDTERHARQFSSDESQVAVAVTVHRQDGDVGLSMPRLGKTKSNQTLLNHSYQALQGVYDEEEKQINLIETTSCDCDLECTCGAKKHLKAGKNRIHDRIGGGSSSNGSGSKMNNQMLSADEITVSESDNNSTMLKKKSRDEMTDSDTTKVRNWNNHPEKLGVNGRGGCSRKTANSNCNISQIDIYSDGDEDGTDACIKVSNAVLSEDDQTPPLPPRPPPRPKNVAVNTNAHRVGVGGIKKYVVWCLICGGFSCLLGVLFLGVYFLLHSYTITVGSFETVPTFVPATLLILTGLCIMSLARRKNRYSYLIKLSGACGLISALTCALVTVTTTVLHMSRLQALRECEYAQKTRTCTCYSDLIESQVERVDKEGVRLVFDSLSDCGVVHGSLYSCLRAIFGLSVAGVLIAVFSCMLVYQLLSHERKKMYWEQLELRCRSLYTSQQGPPPPNMAVIAGRANACRCCEQCHAHRQIPLQPSAYPWDDGSEGPRFWTGRPPGNFYSPNPGGDDMHHIGGIADRASCRGQGLSNSRSRMAGWSWPRMPWQRNSPMSSGGFHQTPSSPDSQYGFSNVQPATASGATNGEEQGFREPNTGSLSYGVWGPPPPYSDPNSPAKRGYYQFMQHPSGDRFNVQGDRQTESSSTEQPMARPDCRAAHRSVCGMDQQTPGMGAFCIPPSGMRNTAKRQMSNAFRANNAKGDYENTPSDSDGGARDRSSNTLPTRKMKKRVEAGAKSIGPNSQATQRVNVQHVFSTTAQCASEINGDNEAHTYHELTNIPNDLDIENIPTNAFDGRISGSGAVQAQVGVQRHQQNGVENIALQRGSETNTRVTDAQNRVQISESCDPTESEVYFADVSSCCNVSVKNDTYYDDANHTHIGLNATDHHHNQMHLLKVPNANEEDYLAHRFGQRENSVRSRLPFPQTCNDDYDREATNIDSNGSSEVPPNHNHQNGTTNLNDNNLLQKESSRQSMCSVESEAKTEFTDLSPATPCSSGNGFSVTHSNMASFENSNNGMTSDKFVASFPFSSESQSLEAHRRSTKNIGNEQLPDLQQQQHHRQNPTQESQYEVINESVTPCKNNFPTTTNFARSTNVKGPQFVRPISQRTIPSTIIKSNDTQVHHHQDKGHNLYPSDVDWPASGGFPNDRQPL